MEVVMSFREAFETVATNPLLQLCEPGISTCKLVSQVNKALEKNSACTEKLVRLLSDKFYNLLNTRFLSTAMKEKIIVFMHYVLKKSIAFSEKVVEKYEQK